MRSITTHNLPLLPLVGLMRRRHDRLRGHRQDVGVPPAPKDPARGVVEDEVVADVDPESRVHVREEGEHHGEGGAGHAQREGDGQVGPVKEVDGVHERGPVEDGARPENTI